MASSPKVDRLNKIITSAIKQSIKAWHPVLNEPIALSRLLSASLDGQKFIAHCEPGDKLSLKEQKRAQEDGQGKRQVCNPTPAASHVGCAGNDFAFVSREGRDFYSGTHGQQPV